MTRGQTGLLGRGRFRIDLSYRHTDQDAARAGDEATDQVLRPKLFLERGTTLPLFHRDVSGRESFAQLDLGYGLTDRLMILASVPLLAHRVYEIAHVGKQQRYTTDGFGDVVVGLRRSLGPVVAGLALKAPTADHRLGPDFDGSVLDPTLQPGSGAWDVVGSVQHGRRLAGVDWTVAGSYEWTTTNDFTYRFGNEAILTLTAARHLVGGLSGSAQVKLFHQDRNRFRDLGVASTGATFVYLTPGLRVEGPSGTSLYGFYQMLPYRYVNDAQLTPRHAFLVGASKSF